MKIETKNDVRKTISDLYEIAERSGEYISSIQTAFIYHSAKPLQDLQEDAERNQGELASLAEIIREAAADDISVKPYADVPGHLVSIWKSLENISVLVDKKIRENVLFSDKAVDETIYLLQRLVEVLRPAADMILARNTFLRRYIQESQASIEKMAGDYATLHENRLVTGECLSTASSIYVSMLESIKSIAWHTREIAHSLGR